MMLVPINPKLEATMEFNKFKSAVAKQFAKMSKGALFTTAVDKDKMWETYLAAFPEGSNLIYRKRTEHDCSCCKQFIRAVGNVVAIEDGRMISIWDVIIEDQNYQEVADAMSDLVRSAPIDNIFLHYKKTAGTDKSFEQIVDGVKTWEHFFVNIPPRFVINKKDIGTKMSDAHADHDVFLRSLVELTDDSVDTVLELIAQNSLYRGEEHKFVVNVFKVYKNTFDKIDESSKDNFVWSLIDATPKSVLRIRNSAIGTLLIDLSKGKELEQAVKAFESVVAPSNYKRPTALVTKSMIESAKKKIQELGLTSALERRYATINDITINNILFADRSAKKVITGDVFDELSESVSENRKSFDKVEEVSIEKFLSDVLPTAQTIELMMDNSHKNNLVSLIAPVDPTAGSMFKWDNKFSWSYNGEMTDSIKEKVKKAGGNVTGDLCCRLTWYNRDDLDLHMIEPDHNHIYFHNKGELSRCGGMLDVDMNAGWTFSTTPVENIFYSDKKKMKEGVYELYVNQFALRDTGNVGFEVEIDFMGKVWNFVYDKMVKQGEDILVANFKYSKAEGIAFLGGMDSTKAVKTIWGVNTNTFQKVKTIMYSPNHWDGHGIGNKHFFFMLENCVNDEGARGFYNEFLKEEFTPHRKVFEIVGGKTKVADSNEQLSGLGFSSTQRNSVLCRVTGKFTRVIKVLF